MVAFLLFVVVMGGAWALWGLRTAAVIAAALALLALFVIAFGS